MAAGRHAKAFAEQFGQVRGDVPVGFVRRVENEIARLDIGLDVFVPGRFKRLAQFPHRQALAATDIDPAEESDPPVHERLSCQETPKRSATQAKRLLIP